MHSCHITLVLPVCSRLQGRRQLEDVGLVLLVLLRELRVPQRTCRQSQMQVLT